MSDLSEAAAEIAQAILGGAVSAGGNIWNKIQQSAVFHFRAYSTFLVDIAAAVAAGEISKRDGRIFAQNARLLLVQGIANTAQIFFTEVQTFINSVLSAVKAAVNARLPIPLL